MTISTSSWGYDSPLERSEVSNSIGESPLALLECLLSLRLGALFGNGSVLTGRLLLRFCVDFVRFEDIELEIITK